MKLESLHIGMTVQHPQYGIGEVKSIGEHTADVLFEEGRRTVEPTASGMTPAAAHIAVSGLDQPLQLFVDQILTSTLRAMGYDRPDAVVDQLGARWHSGRAVLHPADPTLQTKEIPLEVLFHKIVMVRNNLRVLEQKINAHPVLSDADKVEMQQYITKSYGSLTTFNLLFKEKEEGF
jgi:hypothetical protein